MTTSRIAKTKSFFIKSLQLQIFLTMISLPILIYWGLPLSLASPIGNIIFTPFLSIFLFFSSLIFFFEIFEVPNEIFIWLLNRFCQIWNYLLSLGSESWLIGFPLQSNLIIFLIPFLALVILHNRKTNNNYSIIYLSTILIVSCLFLKINLFTDETTQILKKNDKTFEIILKKQKIKLIDHGILNSSCESWIEYNLLPELIKKFGHSNIEEVVIEALNKKTKESIKFLLKKLNINSIYIKKYNKKYSSNEFLQI